MQSIEKLLEKQKAIDAKRRKINAMIRQAQEEEQKGKFIKAGEELFEHFKTDPKCIDSDKIAAICNKYFFLKKDDDTSKDSEKLGKDSKNPVNTK